MAGGLGTHCYAFNETTRAGMDSVKETAGERTPLLNFAARSASSALSFDLPSGSTGLSTGAEFENVTGGPATTA